MTVAIDRAFVRLATGLVHYRRTGTDTTHPPLVLLHGGPGSSAGLVPLIAALATTRRVIAPDTAGCGDSAPLADAPTIVRYAAVLDALLDRLHVPHADIYGHHTGAQIATELAIAAPGRVRRLVLDGLGLFPPELRSEFVDRYAPPIVPAADGSHLAWIWDFASALTRHFPHYARDAASRVEPPTELSPAQITGIVAEVLKAGPGWHLAYRAAFTHDLAARLPLVAAPALVLRVAGDPLATYAAPGAALLAKATVQDVEREQRAATIARFLDA